MPGKGHHSQEWHDCWESVQAKGHSAESAAAICTASLQDAGKAIYANEIYTAIGKPFKSMDLAYRQKLLGLLGR